MRLNPIPCANQICGNCYECHIRSIELELKRLSASIPKITFNNVSGPYGFLDNRGVQI